jgi:very-short-patch-repair endonuclease
MHVFTSMLHSLLRIDSTSSQGLVALKNFLEFAQYKRTSHAKLGPREPDSDFEIAVGRALNQRGYECEYQVGAAGHFIDLAVRDPGNPGRFLMGVECDGATYHSAKSVRDRDRLRQEVLEGLGWKIMRIWSTDWFTNPEGQLNPILTELDNLRTEPVEPIESYEEALDESDREILEFMDQRETLSLNDLLHTFDEEVIRVEQPDVEPARRLLSNAMVEALVHHQPMAKQEFTELVPQYLRSKVDPRQGKFLDQVLEIIENYEAEVAR